MKKRANEAPDAAVSARRRHDLSTLSVFTYHGPLAMHFIPLSQTAALLPALLSAVFGSRVRHSVFSLCSNTEGSFLLLDETLHRELFGGSCGVAPWSCLYIHEASSERSGAEVSGALSLLCDQLAAAQVPVLNVCTLARNFMIVKSALSDVAVSTLRSAVEGPTPNGNPSAPPAEPTMTTKAAAAAGVRLQLLRGLHCIGSLSVEQLKECSHAVLHLLFLRKGAHAFTHFFEMAGEISLTLEEDALKALEQAEPTSAKALSSALQPRLSRGWRVLDITAPAGGDGIGILGAVCRPLAKLPLMNFSTLDHTYVLFPEAHLDEALKKLKPSFDVVLE